MGSDVEVRIRTMLASGKYGAVLPSDFASSDSLFRSGVVDSFGFFSLIAALEYEFAVRILSEEMHPGNFDTIHRLETFIVRKQSEKSV